MNADPSLLAELQQHLAEHTPSCNARTDHLMRRAAWALGLPRPAHVGGNAEDCPGCEGTNPPYPFICPGPDAVPAAGGVVSAAPDRADAPAVWVDGHSQLEAIAAAVYEQCEIGDGGIVHDDPRNIAVAALGAVLPPPAEAHRLALSEALGLGTGAPWDAIYDRATELGLPPLDRDPVAQRLGLVPPPADRAAVLREAADILWNHPRATAIDSDFRSASHELRRVADEAQQQDDTETPFVPPTHYRGTDGTEFCAHAVPVGPDSCRECRDLNQPAAPTRTAASDVLAEAVAALQAKATELSTEAEEEMRRDLEEQAQVWHEAADMVRRVGRKAAPR